MSQALESRTHWPNTKSCFFLVLPSGLGSCWVMRTHWREEQVGNHRVILMRLWSPKNKECCNEKDERPPSPPLLSPMSSPSCGALSWLPSSSQTDVQLLRALESSVCFCHNDQVYLLQVAGSLCPLCVVRSSCWVHGHASSFEIREEHSKALVLWPSSKASDQPGNWKKPGDRWYEIEIAYSLPSHKCWPIGLMSLLKVPQHNWNVDAQLKRGPGLIERGQLRGKPHRMFCGPLPVNQKCWSLKKKDK